jgi:CopG family transcriptional regulator/antitoxin EndoAI
MSRSTIICTISLPPQMTAELDEMARKDYRTRSELIREALRRYRLDWLNGIHK